MKETFKARKWGTINSNIYEKDWHMDLPPEDSRDVLKMAAICRIPIISFDAGRLKNKKINGARLYLKVEGEKHPLKLDITSISQDWNSSFATLVYCDRGKNWADDKWFTDVIMGNGNSFHSVENVEYESDTRIACIHLPPKFVYAMINGQSFGLGLIDEKSQPYKDAERDMQPKLFNVNPRNGMVPKLVVDYEDFEYNVPDRAYSLKAQAVSDEYSFEYTSVKLSWKIENGPPGEYRFFNIYVSEEKTALGRMKRVQKFDIPDYNTEKGHISTEIGHLKPGRHYRFALTVANNGFESEPVYAEVKTGAAVKRPEIENVNIEDAFTKGAMLSKGGFAVYVLDDISKANPVNGNIFEMDSGDYLPEGVCNLLDYKNRCFDGEKIRLTAAPGEKLGLQLLIENRMNEGQSFTAAAKSKQWDGCRVNLNRVWYLKCNEGWYPEVAVPAGNAAEFDIPFKENKIPGQRFQSLFVDFEILKDCMAGDFELEITIGNGSSRANIPVYIKVEDISLEKADFGFELNGYMPVYRFMGYNYRDADREAVEDAYYETAYRHNCGINILPYTQYGKVFEGFAPKIGYIDGEARVTDWSEWDAHFGRYLDGSYMMESEGEKVPVTHIYLPFHENWPMPVDRYMGHDIENRDYPGMINEYALKSGGIKNDFKPGYRLGIKSVVKDFIKHFDEKGWQNVEFLFYTNNKHYSRIKNHLSKRGRSRKDFWTSYEVMGDDGKGTSWWILEEQVYPSDFKATAFFGEILKEAQKELKSGSNIKYRSDISRYHHIFDYLDNKLDIAALNLRSFKYLADRAKKRKKVFNEEYWGYGGLSKIYESNASLCVWIINAYVNGASRILPWNNFGIDRNYEHPQDTAILYPGSRFGLKQPAVSLRLKAIRKGMEIQKYLHTFKTICAFNDIQLKEYIKSFINLKGENQIKHFDDAGYVQFEDIGNENLERLKRHIQKVILKKQELKRGKPVE